jgi:hypothetical protein
MMTGFRRRLMALMISIWRKSKMTMTGFVIWLGVVSVGKEI